MARTTKHTPTRTCIGCRESVDTEQLERFVVLEGNLIYDMRSKAPGRGAYLHPRCLEIALKKNAFSRAFKQNVSHPTLDDLRQTLSDGIAKRVQEHVTTCVRAQGVTIGQNQTAEATQNNRVALMFIANDAGASTVQKFQSNAGRKGIAVLQHYSAQEIGSLCGKVNVSILGITHAALAQQIANDFDNLRQLGVFDS